MSCSDSCDIQNDEPTLTTILSPFRPWLPRFKMAAFAVDQTLGARSFHILKAVLLAISWATNCWVHHGGGDNHWLNPSHFRNLPSSLTPHLKTQKGRSVWLMFTLSCKLEESVQNTVACDRHFFFNVEELCNQQDLFSGGKKKKSVRTEKSKPVECVRVWPLTSLNVLQSCCSRPQDVVLSRVRLQQLL